MKTNENVNFEFDEVPELPTYQKWEIYDEELTYQEFIKSKNRFIVYEKENGEVAVLFDKMNETLYACMVAKLSYPLFEKVVHFLKLVLEGVRLIKKQTKIDHEKVGQIEKYIKNKNL